MVVHYVWVGNKDLPARYINNFQTCKSLNPTFTFKVWENQECNDLLQEYGLSDYAKSLSFIAKYNLVKYLILGKEGGIYTDFDIKWRIPFKKIINDYNFPKVDIILTVASNSPFFVKKQQVFLLDDPFIICKPNLLNKCVSYCLNRKKFSLDGDLYMSKKILKISPVEPVGPFGLTEWIHINKIKTSCFTQDTLLDANGFYEVHEQKNIWKLK